MTLRPHHLLCTQNFIGKGYNPEFVEHMTSIVKYLTENPSTAINITLSTDDICKKCPHKLGSDNCAFNEKVKLFDKKMTEHFNIKEGEYIYGDIIRKINDLMTISIHEDVCFGCQWGGVCYGVFVAD